MNMLALYNICYVILIKYMLDSALEPSYTLTKNLLLLPWILNLIVDMTGDSTPLLITLKIFKRNITIVMANVSRNLSLVMETAMTIKLSVMISVSTRRKGKCIIQLVVMTNAILNLSHATVTVLKDSRFVTKLVSHVLNRVMKKVSLLRIQF